MRPRIALALLLLLAACDGRTGAPAEGPVAAPSPASPQPLPSPGKERPSETLPDGRQRLYPSSARVEPGVPYIFELYTHCGLDFLLDFDGSFWKVAEPGSGDDGSGNPPEGFGNPFDTGTMTLVDDDTARYVSDNGPSVDFTRQEGPIDTHLCA